MVDKITNVKQQTQVPEEYKFEGEKVQTISLDSISKSLRREKGLQGIRGVPVQFWKFINIVTAMLDKNDMNYSMRDIHVQNNSSKAYLSDTQKEQGYNNKFAPIDRWRFDKVLLMIDLPNVVQNNNDIARNASIGLSLNKEGLSIAFGMNVHECANFDILGGTVLRSYSYNRSEAMSWELMEFKMGQWIRQLDQIWKVQNDIMHDMLSHEIGNPEIIDQLIGDLYVGAIKNSYFKGGEVPFNTYELSDFVQEMIKNKKDEAQIRNVWDVYNWGTSIMKPGNMDIGEIANSSNLWCNYLLGEFNIAVQECEIIE